MKINKRFQKFIDDRNFWKQYRNEPIIQFPLSQADVDDLAGRLSADLSPENLSCDGERPRAQVISRGKMLNNVYKDLSKYGEKNGLVVPELYY